MPDVRPIIYVRSVLYAAACAALGFFFSPGLMGALIGLAMSVVILGPMWAHELGFGPDAPDASKDADR